MSARLLVLGKLCVPRSVSDCSHPQILVACNVFSTEGQKALDLVERPTTHSNKATWSKNHLRNQSDKLQKSKNHLRSQTDKFLISKNHFRNQTNKTRIKTYNYYGDWEGGWFVTNSDITQRDIYSYFSHEFEEWREFCRFFFFVGYYCHSGDRLMKPTKFLCDLRSQIAS